MTASTNELAPHLSAPSKIGTEISLTGKWTPKRTARLFGRSSDTVQADSSLKKMAGLAASTDSVLTFEIDSSVGGNSFLVHCVFSDSEALVDFFENVASAELSSLAGVATPDLHLVRGLTVSESVGTVLDSQSIPFASGEYLYGYVKHDSALPDLSTAIDVTAKWTCKPGPTSHKDALKHWWQQVGTDAFSMEKGLVRFEAYQLLDEDALIIHETFSDTAELKFHLTKGTAHKYKKSIDEIAVPERYYFRGPVSWLIRTYSKFMRLPATYSTRTSRHAKQGGNMSEGTTN